MNLAHVFQTGDPVLVVVFLLLIAMSLASWYVIFWKLCELKTTRAEIAAYRATGAAKGSVALLTDEAARLRTGHSEASVGVYLAQALDTARVKMDRGLTMLASIGSSAPFIGLFGTVWGVYQALTRIAAEGNAGLNVVAGPMGEALVATAIGLFAAIPAVLAYNAFVRTHRVAVQELRHIAERLELDLLKGMK